VVDESLARCGLDLECETCPEGIEARIQCQTVNSRLSEIHLPHGKVLRIRKAESARPVDIGRQPFLVAVLRQRECIPRRCGRVCLSGVIGGWVAAKVDGTTNTVATGVPVTRTGTAASGWVGVMVAGSTNTLATGVPVTGTGKAGSRVGGGVAVAQSAEPSPTTAKHYQRIYWARLTVSWARFGAMQVLRIL
jgi:hypothetical protein